MKKIIIMITPTGLFYTNGVVMLTMSLPGEVKENLFIKSFNEARTFCLN